MQMPISNAAPTPSPSSAPAVSNAASGTTSSTASTGSSAASVKGKDNGKFNQAFASSLAGTQGKDANAQTASDAAAPANVVSTMNTLASLLGSDLSSSDLLGAIEALLQKLGDTDTQELAQTTTESDLADALKQLEMLLSTLNGVPLLVQPSAAAATATADAPAGEEGESTGDSMPTSGALLAILANTNASAAGDTAIQAAESTVPNQAQAVVANLEEINALKAGLQEALADLRSLIQDQKGLSANKEQLAQISKQLTSIERLVSGNKAEAADAASQTTDTASNEAVDSVRALQTPQAPQANTHLQRMAHRLLHVGLLNAVQKPADKGASASETEALKLPAETMDLNAQLGAVNADMQRQMATVNKPAITQPVPVQQFASTIQGMVVKAFNVTTVNGVAQAQLTLYPEHLGQVNVNISVHNGTLTAQFLTDTVTAKDMLENQMAQLRTALQSQGLQVDKLVVSQTSVQPDQFQDRQGAQGQQQGSAKRNQSNDNAVDEIDFAADVEEWNAQQAAARELGLGRGIHTIA